jgi:hypothetical protein
VGEQAVTPTKMDPSKVAQELENFALVLNNVVRHAADLAHARRALFDAYVAEGFTDAQALELCKHL